MIDGYLSQGEAAAVLVLGEATLQKWRRRGEGPPWKTHGLRTVVYPREALVAWCEDNNVAYDLSVLESVDAAAGS